MAKADALQERYLMKYIFRTVLQVSITNDIVLFSQKKCCNKSRTNSTGLHEVFFAHLFKSLHLLSIQTLFLSLFSKHVGFSSNLPNKYQALHRVFSTHLLQPSHNWDKRWMQYCGKYPIFSYIDEELKKLFMQKLSFRHLDLRRTTEIWKKKLLH